MLDLSLCVTFHLSFFSSYSYSYLYYVTFALSKVSLGSGETDEVISRELAGVTEGVRGSEGMVERRVTARLSTSRLKRRGERIRQ